jgi:hypothetical protein
MAEQTVVHIGENSPEEVALKLFDHINVVEDRKNRTREEILALYAECLLVIRDPHQARASNNRTK